MTWPTPQYSRKAVSRAGATLIDQGSSKSDQEAAFSILNNWRACHGYPINTFQATLRDKLNRLTSDYLVAQRLKRTPSIVAKLRRFPSMNLARMQDIGGLRAVVPTVDTAKALREDYRRSRFDHQLLADTDYIDSPKESGYRGYHLVYRYRSRKRSDYDGLQLELQIRTRTQHAWATAVETAGTFLDSSLKTSEGPDRWLEFFSIVSTAFAAYEGTNPVSQWSNMSKDQLRSTLARMADELGIVQKLGAFRVAVDAIKKGNLRGSYCLIVLDPGLQSVRIETYAKSRLDEATRDYAEVETKIAQGGASQAVLVAASSIDQLQRAYPNYFLDTQEFLKLLHEMLEG